MQIVLLLFVFKNEPVNFLIAKGKTEEAKIAVKLVYKNLPDAEADKIVAEK